jgi:hypothetical protein
MKMLFSRNVPLRSAKLRAIRALGVLAIVLWSAMWYVSALGASWPMQSPATDCTGDWGGIPAGFAPVSIGTTPTSIAGVNLLYPSNPGFATVRSQYICHFDGVAVVTNGTASTELVTLQTDAQNKNNTCAYTVPLAPGTQALPFNCLMYSPASALHSSGAFAASLYASASGAGLTAMVGTHFAGWCCPGGGM